MLLLETPETWTTTEEAGAQKEREEDVNWAQAAKKRRRTGGDSAPSGSAPMPSCSRALQRAKGRSQERIELSHHELAACCDALGRAQYAADAACQLCERAGRAFREEARCISTCKDVLRSYIEP